MYELTNFTRICISSGLFSLLTCGSAGEFGSIELNNQDLRDVTEA